MSTKIYDAYRFKRNYNMHKFASIIDKWRNDITNMASINYAKSFLNMFTYYTDMLLLRGPDYIEQLIKLCESNNPIDKNQIELYKALLSHDVFSIKIRINDILSESIKKPTDEYGLHSLFKSEICVYPMRRKILFIYFGNKDYQKYITDKNNVLDYHYQNQCDKPENISNRKWKQRAADWDIALGQDSIPINHGFHVQFITPTNYQFSIFNDNFQDKNMTKELFPDTDTRIKCILETYDDYPNPPENKAASNWNKYSHSQEYKDWEIKKYNEIKSKITYHPIDIFTKNVTDIWNIEL